LTSLPRRPTGLTGFFDFYFAGVDTWLFDIAVCLNDWCIDLATGTRRARARHDAFLQAYASPCARLTARRARACCRPCSAPGPLRFWISRLWDFYLPREASMLKPHDPTHFERVLRQRVAHAVQA
jgi:homoserine kinase type II